MINKQEAIETLQSKAVNHYSETRGWTKRVELDLAIDIINQFNEPEKPVVPQFLADWYENNKNDIENSIYKLCIDFYLETLDEKLHDWFGDPKNKPIETIRNMKFYGYEVEKEKLYEVFLKRNGAQLGVCIPDGEDKAQFTEEELKEFEFDNLNVYEVKEVEE